MDSTVTLRRGVGIVRKLGGESAGRCEVAEGLDSSEVFKGRNSVY